MHRTITFLMYLKISMKICAETVRGRFVKKQWVWSRKTEKNIGKALNFGIIRSKVRKSDSGSVKKRPKSVPKVSQKTSQKTSQNRHQFCPKLPSSSDESHPWLSADY